MAKDVIDSLIADINKTFNPNGTKKNVAKRGSDVEEVVRIPCNSPALTYLLGGGWVRGQLHEIFGPEHAGKTTVTLMALMDCLKWERKHGDPEKVVAFIDIEHRFNPEWAEAVGLEVDQSLLLIQPPDAESGNDIMLRLIKSDKVCAIAFDSVGAALPAYAHQEMGDKSTRQGGNASVMARNVNTVSPLANLYNVTVFYLNQLRADMAGYNRPMTPGGHAVKHAMSFRIYLRPGRDKYFDKITDGVTTETQVGFPILFKTVKNSYGPAMRQQWSDFYNQPNRWLDHVGFDREKDLQRLGLLTGVASQAGAWYTYDDIKAQGRDAFFAAIQEAGRMEEYENAVMSALFAGRAINGEEEQAPLSDAPDINDPDV